MARFQDENLDEVKAESLSGDKVKKAKFDPNFKYRIGFPFTKKDGDKEKVRIIKVGYFNRFDQNEGGIKKSFLVTANDELNQQLTDPKLMGAVQYRYVTPIIIYGTDASGNLLSPPSYSIIPLVVSADNLKTLQDIDQEFGLAESDVFVRLKDKTDPKFQNLSITACKDAKWRLNESLKAKVIQECQNVSESMHLSVAIDASESQIKKWLGLDSGEESTPAQTTSDDAWGAVEEAPKGASAKPESTPAPKVETNPTVSAADANSWV